MPHIPDHLTHDPELIAAYAAGDAVGPDLAAATELVAACTECAELHRDLRSIATALPELPVPARTRDFRLTPTQAASLAPSGWRGVLAAFASPRFRLAAPLGTGLAAAGLAGLLLATPGGLGTGGTSGTSVPVGGAASGVSTTAEGGAAIDNPVPEGAALADASEPAAAQAAPSAAASDAPASAADTENHVAIVPDVAPAAGSTAATSGESRNATSNGAAASQADDVASQLRVKTSDSAYATTPAATPIAPATDNTPLAVLGAVLLVVGVLLAVLRIGARLVA